MEFRQIQYFVCLYEEGSVTRAARRLNIVQPALSMQIAKLEDELGERLFVRSSQGMQPTSEGRRVYQLFLPAMVEFARAREQARRTSGELTGHVRVGMIATIAQGVLVDALLEFAASHPKVELSLTDGFSGMLTDAVALGQLDAAVINKPRRPLTLQTTPIAEEDLVLVTGMRHAALPGSLPLSDVATLKLALPTRQHGLRGILESFAQAEDIDLNPSVEIDSISAILKLVRESDFCTLLPNIAVRQQLERGELRGYDISSPRLVRQIVYVTDQRRPLSAAAVAFVTVLARHIRGLEEGEHI
ncbi:MAG: LysR family transcriptional regulator [Burkholderiaceae bacterium]|nr:MAG: LysR family transcriptional regulator [Burkholderiaceae bacterium]